MNRKIWVRLFFQIAAIIAVFVVVLSVSNHTFLFRYYLEKQKNLFGHSVDTISSLDLSDTDASGDDLSNLERENNLLIDIYNQNGRLIYTTIGFSIRQRSSFGGFTFEGQRRPVIVLESQTLKNGAIFETLQDNISKTKYLAYRTQLSDENTVELRVQKDLIERSAEIASQFMLIVSVVCLSLSLLWALLYARRFVRPIEQMNSITKKMADLDFSQRLTPFTSDEVGELGKSINALSEKLDKTLGELHTANEKLSRELEMERSLDDMRRQFVANVSHELKTPLSIIGGYAEGLRLNITDSPEKSDEYCDVIMQECDRMNRLVLDLLELSKYESGQMNLALESFDLLEFVTETAAAFFGLFEKQALKAEIDVPPDVVVFADKLRISQVLGNYLSNALAHAQKGGRLRLWCEPQDATTRVFVYNSGKQIPTEELPLIWQSFYRTDKARGRDEGRYGLGLSIVRAIQQLHNMGYGVYNTNTGVVFWFDLQSPDSADPQ